MLLQELADKISAKIHEPESSPLAVSKDQIQIHRVSPLLTAQPGDITFLTNPRWISYLKECKATAIITRQILPDCQLIQLLHPHPQLAMAKASQAFYKPYHSFAGQSPLAYVDVDAIIHPTATIYPFAYIGKNTQIAAGCYIYPHTYIGDNCQIRENTVIYPGVVIMEDSLIGQNVMIHGGAILGGDGFGFVPDKETIHKIPQTGKVVIEDEVEIGALATIDRATFEQTIVRKGAKLDSQVHLGHNVDIGEMSMLCGQVGIAGSTRLGKKCIAAGQAGAANGLTIADGVILGPQAGALSSLDKAGEYHGIPASPATSWKRQVLSLKRLPELIKTIKLLEGRLHSLEKFLANKTSERT